MQFLPRDKDVWGSDIQVSTYGWSHTLQLRISEASSSYSLRVPQNGPKPGFPLSKTPSITSIPDSIPPQRAESLPPAGAPPPRRRNPAEGMAAPVAAHENGPGRGKLSSGPQSSAERLLRTAGQEAGPRREETWHWPGGTRRFLRAAAALAPPRPRPGYLLLQMP